MNDERLRQAMKDAHAGEKAPTFAVAARAGARIGRRAGWMPWVALGSAACAVLIAVVLVRPGAPRLAPTPVDSFSSWRGPTDFLLETPGMDVLREVPKLSGDTYDPSEGVHP